MDGQLVPVPTLSFDVLTTATPCKPTMAQLKALQEECLKLPQITLTPVHKFVDGMYCRELAIVKGLVVVGRIHRHEHFVSLIQGEATVYTEEGMARLKAPMIWVSKPGTKRALYTHKNCVFATFHLNPTNTQDIDALEDDIIIPEDDEQAYLEAIKWLSHSPPQ